jgi:translocation and assembly module TamB
MVTRARPPCPTRAQRGVALLRGLVWLALGLLLAIAALAAWVVGTSAGTAGLLAQVGLQVSAPQGALAGGPFAAARVHWLGASGRLVVDDLRWTDLRWHWRPHAQAWVGLDLVEARARRVEWRSIENAASTAPLRPPASLRLPVHARLLDLQVERIEVDDLPPLEALRLSAELGADDGAVHRVQQLAVALEALRLRARGEIGADGEMPLALRVDAESAPRRHPAWTAWLEASGPLQRQQVQARIDVTDPAAGADLRATLAPFAAWPLVALQAESRDLDLAALAPGAPRTRLSGRIDVRSSALDAPIEVDVALTNAAPGRWDQRRLPLASLALALGGRLDDRGTVELSRFDARFDGGGVPAGRWTGQGRWQGDRLTLDTTLTDLRPARLDARAPDLTLGGPIVLHASGLPSPDPAAPPATGPRTLQATLRVNGRHGGLPGAPPVSVTAEVGGEHDGARLQLDLPRFEARAGAAQAALTASARRDAGGAWRVASRGRLDGFDPAPWWPGAADDPLRHGPHRLNLRWDGDVALAAVPSPATTRGRAELTITGSVVAGLPLAGQATWSRAPGAADGQAAVDVELAGNRLEADGRVGDPGQAMAWRVAVRAPRLAALRPLARLDPALAAWLPSAGALDARVDADGVWPRLRTRGDAQVQGLRIGDVALAQAQARWTATLDPAARPDDPLELALDVAGLARGEQRLDRLRASVGGRWSAHTVELDASLPLRPPAWIEAWPSAINAPSDATDGSGVRLRGEGRWTPGAATASTTTSSPLADGTWQASVGELLVAPRDATGAPRPGGWLQARDVALAVAFDADGAPREVRAAPGRMQVLDAVLRWTTLQWSAPAPGVEGSLALDAEVEPLAVAPWLQRLQPAAGWSGDLRLGATARVRLGERFDADLVVDRRGGDLEIRDNGSRKALGLTDLRVALAAHDGLWQLTQAAAAGNLGVIAGAQTLRVPPQAAWPDADTPLEGVLELRVDRLDAWAAWLPPGWRLDGTLRTSASIGGRWGAPEYIGEMVGRDLAVRNLLEGVDVRDGELRLTLRGADATVEAFKLRAGEGTLEVAGGANFGERPQARLRLRADQFQLLGRVDRRIVVSGDAAMALGLDAIRVDGRFGVDRGLIDFTRRDAPSLDDDVTVVRRGEAPPAADAPRPPPRRPVQVDVAVDLGRDLRLRGRGLDTMLRGNLTLTTPGGRPALVGTVRAEYGTYRAYDQRLTIDRGEIVFTGPVDNPRLDILAVRPNLDVEVGVEIGGTVQSPRVRLYSDPAMSDADTLSWLILGRAPDGLGRADTALLQAAAMALLAGEGESTTGRLLRTIGIDELTVSRPQDGTTEDAVVTVGKQIGSNLFVAYERGVNATSGSWQLIYRVARRLTVRAQTGEDTALDVIWSWRWD